MLACRASVKDSLHVRAVGYGRNASAPSGLTDAMNTSFDGQRNVTSGWQTDSRRTVRAGFL